MKRKAMTVGVPIRARPEVYRISPFVRYTSSVRDFFHNAVPVLQTIHSCGRGHAACRRDRQWRHLSGPLKVLNRRPCLSVPVQPQNLWRRDIRSFRCFQVAAEWTLDFWEGSKFSGALIRVYPSASFGRTNLTLLPARRIGAMWEQTSIVEMFGMR